MEDSFALGVYIPSLQARITQGTFICYSTIQNRCRQPPNVGKITGFNTSDMTRLIIQKFPYCTDDILSSIHQPSSNLCKVREIYESEHHCLVNPDEITDVAYVSLHKNISDKENNVTGIDNYFSICFKILDNNS